MRRFVVVTVGLLLTVSACSEGTADAGRALPGGNADAFCVRWPEARSAILSDIESGDNAGYEQAVATVRKTLDEIEVLVPPEVESLWERATAFRRTVADLIDIAGSPRAVRAELIEAAFPAGDPEAAQQVALDAVAVLDEWSITQCGDFCELWPRLDRALAWNISEEHGGIDWAALAASGRDTEALLSLAESLVPEEIADAWASVRDFKLELIALMRESQESEDPGNEFGRRVGEIIGPDRLWTRFMGPDVEGVREGGLEAEAERLGLEPWTMGSYIEEVVREPIVSWVAANCETVGTSGVPGSITVHTREGETRARGTLLVVALPVGTDIRTTDSARDYYGAVCFDGYPAQEASRNAFLLDREEDFTHPCAWLEGWDHGGPRQAVLDAGRYDLFFGLFTRGIGDYDDYLAAPETCAMTTVAVDGDIDVDVPALEPCEMQYIAGSAEEYARRNPPPPAEPTGTLRVLVTGAENPGAEGEFVHGGVLRAALVPAGTSLNDVGRGDVWPAGTGCLGLPGEDQLRELTEGYDWAVQEVESRQQSAEGAAQQADQRQAEADDLARQAEEMLEQADQLREDSDSLLQQAGAGREDEGALRSEAERLWGEAQEVTEQAEQLGREAEQAYREADGAREEADRMVADAQQMREEADRALRRLEAFEGGIELVVAEFPEVTEGFGRTCTDFNAIIEGFSANPDPARIPYGSYDVYFQQSWFGPEAELHLCATVGVEIDGDVVIPVPDVGECP